MKNPLDRFAPAVLAAVLVASSGVALTTAALAQTAPAAQPAPMPPMPPHPPMGMRGLGMMRGHHMMMELDRLKTSLKLNASQAALWDKAQGLMKPPTDMRDQMKARRDRMAAMLDDPNFDPRKLAADMDSAEAEQKAKMTAVRDAWFALYDSLNPVQRGQAREFLRSRMGRHHGMGEHGEGMHRHEGGEPGKAPMPR